MSSASLKLPTAKDLIRAITFDTDNGKIWLNEQRMLLVDASVMAQLKADLIAMLGAERAKLFLMRFGYQAGIKDAEISRKLRPHMSPQKAFLAGPQMHNIRGMVKVEPVELSFNIASGDYYGVFNWFDSYEAGVYPKNEHGEAVRGTVCWTLLGYASGYTSYFMGRSIIYQETACTAQGDSCCQIVGKPAEEWPELTDIERAMMPDPVQEELAALRSELVRLRSSQPLRADPEFKIFNAIGESKAFRQAYNLLASAAGSKVTVLLQGETGAGKEAFARSLHAGSERADGPFVAINCACIPPELIESELFGVEKGAFTGASQSRQGKFERAQGGTIFLDEVVELSPRAQAALLRVLQENEYERVGDQKTRRIDVRVVTATNEDLQQAVQGGRFRADLYYRLNVFPIRIPPLRERKEDIPLLVSHFLEKFCGVYKKHIPGISDRGMELLQQYDWPGNIRELENVIERGVILTEHSRHISSGNLFPNCGETPFNAEGFDAAGKIQLQRNHNAQWQSWLAQLLQTDFSLEAFEQDLIQHALRASQGNVSKAARKLGITRPALAYRMKKMGLGGH
ncbi:MAG: sigma-54-dependent Fis family transcriptional regulator [Eikenella sp.]|nr:sigma-54-dependent Fis family transcriptional regulator [Eikenella sp.]